MYRRDLGRMRDDNTADYPWLLDALLTLVREYARMHEEGIQGTERENVVNALLNGLTPDSMGVHRYTSYRPGRL